MNTKTNFKHWLMMCVFLLVIVGSVFSGQIIYVDTDAPGPVGDGSSWTDAHVFLQHALGDASAGDEIRVAQGTYKPNEGILAVPEIDWRTVSFQLINNVVIKGGYAGFGESDPNVRNIELYETILSGDLDGNDIGALDDPSRDENSYHVVTGSGTDANALLDGFTITAGNADGSDSNSQGGGLYNEGGSPTVINCTLSGNVADDGGGMCSSNNSNPTLSNCIIVGNLAFDGGGICCGENSGQTLNNCTITANSAGFKGGGIFGGPGSNSTMTNCILWNNTAEYGPQMYLFGGLLVATYSDIEGGYAGTGNINADPRFVGTDDPHLLPISPCINAGDPSGDYSDQTDIDGEPRVRYRRVDIGADEVFPIAGDFEPDEDVDFADFAIFADHWLAGVE